MIYCPFTYKQAHTTKRKAKKHLLHIKQNLQHNYRGIVFQCKFCKLWHVGEQKTNQRRSKDAIRDNSNTPRTTKTMAKNDKRDQKHISRSTDILYP